MTRFLSLSSTAAVSVIVLGLCLAGVVDYYSGVEIRAYPLYFLPVCLAAWSLGIPATGFVITAAAAIWTAVNVISGLQYSAPYILLINVFSQLVTFSVVAGLLNYARVLLDREKRISSTDRITGLLNSRGFYQLVQFAVASSRESRRPLAFAYIDLDNFKGVNDRFGHQRGDALLKDVSLVLKKVLRETDIVGRLGGDEFAVCLPDTDQDQAMVVLERLRVSLSEVFPVAECKVSASIGAVCWAVPPEDIDVMVTEADSVMYRVKAAGKNRVEISSVK